MTKIIKNLFPYLLVAILSIALWKVFSAKIQNPFKIQTTETTHSLILKEIKTLGNLELASYHFNDIVEQKLVRDYLPDPKALLIIHGEATGCIDLSLVKESSISTEQDTIIVTLPKPAICHFKIDHEKSKIYDSEYAFLNEQLLFEEAYKSAEKQILQTAKASDLLETSRLNAEKLLIPLFSAIAQKPVVLRFE
ncbi:MAG: hypothetical protein ACI9IP_000798 [Arcticibacterium sp.]|jgi:hypothetical protein